MFNKMILATILCTFGLPLTAVAGNLEPTREPATGSNMPTLQGIYNQLSTGTLAPLVGSFQEPTPGYITGTGFTLGAIRDKLPLVDNLNGATIYDVLNGKKFWGLRSDGTWGLKTGNIPARTPDPNSVTQQYGYYASGFNLSTVDTDLAAGNIKKDVVIFGTTGTLVPATGTAYDAKVLTGYTFSNATGSGLNGAMPDNGAIAYTPGNSQQMIPAGYHNGSGSVSGSTNLQSYNIKGGVNIFGVTGKTEVVDTSEASAPATAAGVASGKVAFVNGSKLNGTARIMSYPSLVPKTGQFSVYVTGDDGNLRAGEAQPTPRFTDNGNGTVTDNFNGLIWLKKANCVGVLRDWTTALSDITQLNTDGTMNGNNCGDTSNTGSSNRTDWRLPNIKEFQSLLDYGYNSPALSNSAGTRWMAVDGDPFLSVKNAYYWSSTTYNFGTTSAWRVHFGYCLIDPTAKNTVAGGHVWAVRGGQ